MKKLFKLSIAVFFINNAIAATSFAQLKVGQKLADVLAKQDVGFDFDLFNLSVGESASLAGEVGIRVFPNLVQKTYSRVEPLRFEVALGHSLPIGFVQVSGSKIAGLTGEFVRQFELSSDAFNIIKYPPYIVDSKSIITDKRIPFSAEQAPELLDKDYFRYQVRTAFTISGGIGTDLGVVNLKVDKTYVVYGDIQVEVYKKQDKKVLVRASSLKSKQNKTGVGVSKSFILDVFEVQLVNKVADKLMPTELLRIDIDSKSNGSLLAIEYEFDLSQDSARTAYNEMMNIKNWNFLDVAKVLHGGKEKNLQTLEMKIAAAEGLSKLGKGDVQRVIRSTTNFSETSKGASFDFRLIRSSDKSQFVEQDISMITDPMSDVRSNYRIATVILNEDIGGWLLFNAKQSEVDEANIVLALDPEKNINKLLDINFSYQRSDKSFNKYNQADTAGHIYKLIPGDLHGIGVRDFVEALPMYHKDDVYVDVKLSLEPRAIAVMNRLTDEEIRNTALGFINIFIQDQAIPKLLDRDFGNQRLRVTSKSTPSFCGNTPITKSERITCFSSVYREDIDNILMLLPGVIRVQPATEYAKMYASIVRLQKIGLFKKIGAGIMTRILMLGVLKKTDDIQKFYKFAKLRMHIIGNDNKTATTYELGRNDEFENTTELFKIRSRILNRAYDPSFFE
ncbi:MAG: hypothetical protein IT287_03180 [Bdellovibrionaceae bacterium]|nr:hypothetical protein [Pseudobdellovibrionaceae bacterium]